MLGDRIKEARKAKGLKQEELADLIGAKNTSVSGWENNEHRPSIDLITKMSEVLEVKVSWLLEENEKPDNTKVLNYLIEGLEQLPEEAKREIDNMIDYIKTKYKK